MAREEGFFDELARGLADGTLSRGKALRLMGAALVGGTLASLGIREAAGDPPGCKREGKHCTRTDQCCGSLVCLSGTCQTPTTTTTESPTTTTTETPTTTTTETPTTTTTPMCIPNGGTCTGGTHCCSGNCKVTSAGATDRTCVESCIPSSLTTCTPGTCPSECGCQAIAPGGAFYCTDQPDFSSSCSTSCDCPTGQLCVEVGLASPVCASPCSFV